MATREDLIRTVDKTSGPKQATAERLQVGRSTLYRMTKRYSIAQQDGT